MCCLEVMKFDVCNTSYYVQVEYGAVLCDVTRSWKIIPGGRGKSWKIWGNVVTCYQFW